MAKLWKKGKFCIKIPKKEIDVNILRPSHLLPVITVGAKNTKAGVHTHARNYNFDCDWLI